MKKSTVYLVLTTVAVSALLVVVGVVLGANISSRDAGLTVDSANAFVSTTPVDNNESAIDNSDGSIAIPGYEKIILKEGEVRQSVSFGNPIRNPCYFRITIALADGSVIYSSGMIKPGQTIENIEISRVLDAGKYEGSVIQYDCYSIDDLQPLNGAKTTVLLEVIP